MIFCKDELIFATKEDLGLVENAYSDYYGGSIGLFQSVACCEVTYQGKVYRTLTKSFSLPFGEYLKGRHEVIPITPKDWKLIHLNWRR